MRYMAQPMIGRRNKSWHIVNEFGGLVEEFDGTRKQAEARAAEVERERSTNDGGAAFDYRLWALQAASEVLINDVDAGLDVADGTPDGDKARDAVLKAARELRAKADRRKRTQSYRGAE